MELLVKQKYEPLTKNKEMTIRKLKFDKNTPWYTYEPRSLFYYIATASLWFPRLLCLVAIICAKSLVIFLFKLQNNNQFLRHFVLLPLLRASSRAFLGVLGVFSITVKKTKGGPKTQYSISNHPSLFDGGFYHSQFTGCTIAKAALQTDIFIGDMLVALDSFFLCRKNKWTSFLLVDKLKQRVRAIAEAQIDSFSTAQKSGVGSFWDPAFYTQTLFRKGKPHLFVEGTTNRNKAILSFGSKFLQLEGNFKVLHFKFFNGGPILTCTDKNWLSLIDVLSEPRLCRVEIVVEKVAFEKPSSKACSERLRDFVRRRFSSELNLPLSKFSKFDVLMLVASCNEKETVSLFYDNFFPLFEDLKGTKNVDFGQVTEKINQFKETLKKENKKWLVEVGPLGLQSFETEYRDEKGISLCTYLIHKL